MKKFLKNILANMARAIVVKYQPRIIAITGSVGKTSTRDAILAVLGDRFAVRGSQKSYNNEFGVPLTIIGKDAPGRSFIAWISVLTEAVLVRYFPSKYPRVLVLEMGADHPGDIVYLTSIAKPHIAIVTAVAPVHTEFFEEIDGVAQEKGMLIEALPADGVALLNADDPHVAAMRMRTEAKVITFGVRASADVTATDYEIHYEPNVPGPDVSIQFTIHSRGGSAPVVIAGVIGRPQVTAVLAAVAVGEALGMNISEIALRLRSYVSPPGRLRVVAGIKQTVLIDDTYNASPAAAIEALQALRDMPIPEQNRRIFVFGDMRELGNYTESGHREVGMRAAELGVDLFIAVGELGRISANAAREAGMSTSHVFSFDDQKEAGKFIEDRIVPGDVILIKGSQAMRMERITEELMLEPLRASDLLVRQAKNWKSK